MARPGKRRNVRGGAGRRGTSRPWCLHPPVTRDPGETLEGIYVLEEFPAELALLLWTALRDVSLWAATPEERRTALFSPNAEARRREYAEHARLDPALDYALSMLAGVVSHSAQATSDLVTPACLKLAEWAREKGAMGTAVSFAQAAALASPEDPVAALAVGRLTVEWGERMGRAETWLRRAIDLARRARHWESYGSAYVQLGDIYLGTGRACAAERFYVYARRAARRQQLLRVRGEAMHGLMRVRMVLGDDLEAAETYGMLARRAYRQWARRENNGRLHPRALHLEHDLAQLWLRREMWDRAVTPLRRLLSAAGEPGLRMACQAMLAHAAAALGDARAYELSWKEAWNLQDRPGTTPHAPAALLHLGRAAALTHDWLRVQQTVRAFNDLPPDHRPAPAAEEMVELARRVDEHRAR